jgi:N-acetylmuramoyl-L-alanine amidase
LTPQYIIMHCSATVDGAVHDWDAIKRYHVENRGWSDIGYHLGIERVDNAYTVKFGRQLNQMGAHCKADRMNHRSIGICCVGNFDEVKPPPEQWVLAARVVAILRDSYSLPVEHVLGHGEVDWRKSCPGRQWDMYAFREQLEVIHECSRF